MSNSKEKEVKRNEFLPSQVELLPDLDNIKVSAKALPLEIVSSMDEREDIFDIEVRDGIDPAVVSQVQMQSKNRTTKHAVSEVPGNVYLPVVEKIRVIEENTQEFDDDKFREQMESGKLKVDEQRTADAILELTENLQPTGSRTVYRKKTGHEGQKSEDTGR